MIFFLCGEDVLPEGFYCANCLTKTTLKIWKLTLAYLPIACTFWKFTGYATVSCIINLFIVNVARSRRCWFVLGMHRYEHSGRYR